MRGDLGAHPFYLVRVAPRRLSVDKGQCSHAKPSFFIHASRLDCRVLNGLPKRHALAKNELVAGWAQRSSGQLGGRQHTGPSSAAIRQCNGIVRRTEPGRKTMVDSDDDSSGILGVNHTGRLSDHALPVDTLPDHPRQRSIVNVAGNPGK